MVYKNKNVLIILRNFYLYVEQRASLVDKF